MGATAPVPSGIEALAEAELARLSQRERALRDDDEVVGVVGHIVTMRLDTGHPLTGYPAFSSR
jgi:hypothetical protein